MEPRDHDQEVRRWRHQVKNLFASIKHLRAVATRCDKTDESFAVPIHLAAGMGTAILMLTGPSEHRAAKTVSRVFLIRRKNADRHVNVFRRFDFALPYQIAAQKGAGRCTN